MSRWEPLARSVNAWAFVTVDGGMTRDQLLLLADLALLGQCEVDRLRGPGPGGQKRNKTESTVRLRHRPTGLSALSGESRSQHQNQTRALRRLRERIAFELREGVDLDGYRRPSALAALLARHPVGRSERWLRSAEYLSGAGHLIDLFCASGCSVSEAAGRLGIGKAKLDRLVHADVRLTRKLGELKTAHRGR